MYKILLSTRYLLRRRIAYFAVLAVALCVFIVVVVMTVMVGLVGDFKRKNHDSVGDCVVATGSLVGFPYYEDFVTLLKNTDCVYAVSPVIKSYALLSPQDGDVDIGVEVLGIDLVSHDRVAAFGKTLTYRADDVSKAFQPMYDVNLPGCILGIDLALRRDARSRYFYEPKPPRVALSITCFPLTASGALAKADTGLVSTQIFYYSDNSRTGLARVDGSIVYLPFEQAQLLCGMAGETKRINALYIKFKPAVKLEAGCAEIFTLWQQFKHQRAAEKYANLLDTVTVQSWKS